MRSEANCCSRLADASQQDLSKRATRLTDATTAYIAASLAARPFSWPAPTSRPGPAAVLSAPYTAAVIVVQARPSHSDVDTTAKNAKAG